MLFWNKLLHAILIFYILLDSVCNYFILEFILAYISETDSLSFLFNICCILKSVLYLPCEMFGSLLSFSVIRSIRKSDITALSIAFHPPSPSIFMIYITSTFLGFVIFTFYWLFPFLFIFTFSFTYWLAKILCQYP